MFIEKCKINGVGSSEENSSSKKNVPKMKDDFQENGQI